jgi:serine acetyltransferase
MNKHQKIVYKCAKNSYKAVKENNPKNLKLRTWKEYYKIFKWCMKHESVEHITQQNKWYRHCIYRNIVLD